MATTPYVLLAYMRTSARALALIRAVGRIASFVPRAEKEHWLRWAQIDRRNFLLLLGCVDARKADAAAAATTTVVGRRPAQHLLRFLMRPAVMQLIGDEPLRAATSKHWQSSVDRLALSHVYCTCMGAHTTGRR
jgi:hypothetical protein